MAGLRGGAVRRRKTKTRVMDWWRKLGFPVPRVWARVKPTPKNGGGLLKLQNDIQTCGYEDVQVMWEMLRVMESEATPNR